MYCTFLFTPKYQIFGNLLDAAEHLKAGVDYQEGRNMPWHLDIKELVGYSNYPHGNTLRELNKPKMQIRKQIIFSEVFSEMRAQRANTMEYTEMCLISLCCYFTTALDDENSERNMLFRSFLCRVRHPGVCGGLGRHLSDFLGTPKIPRALWNDT